MTAIADACVGGAAVKPCAGRATAHLRQESEAGSRSVFGCSALLVAATVYSEETLFLFRAVAMRRSFKQSFHQLTGKAHVYPPMELYRPVSFDSVLAAWSDFSASDSSSPFGIYVHLPFCARKCSFCYCDTVISA